ncbi:MAG: lysophospholipid acyltransferase family protein [Negativicutes bacterium]|nr:lysophospholipid acyltransferase family protein [Negativicutes bacterium]
MQYYFVKWLSWVACRLPDGVRSRIGDLIGAMCWPFVPCKRRKMAINNVLIALGGSLEAAEKTVKQSSVRFGRMFMEVLCFPNLDRENIKSHVQMVGTQHMVDALAHGRGAILATAHSGNWELLGAALALHNFPIVGVAQKQTNAAMDKFINEYRTLSGMQITYKSGVREMVSLLGEGKIIGLIMDQDAKQHGVFVTFFGRPASTPAGAAALARLKNAPIVPTFITENADGTHTVKIHPLVWVEKTADRDHDLQTTTQQLTTIIENHVRAHPQEWFWLHNRWKTQPPTN